jgi:ribose transport system substrate-binding protein
MSTETTADHRPAEERPVEQPPAEHRPALKDRNFLLIALLLPLLVVAGVLWFTGVLKPAPEIAIVTAGSNPYWEGVIRGAEDAAKHYDVNLTVIRGTGDETEQSQAVRQLLDDGSLDGMAVSPNDERAQTGLLREVASRMPLVTFDSDAPDSSRLWFVGTDNYFAGWQCGNTIREAIPDGGEVIICVGSIDKENGRLRRQGVIDQLLERTYDAERPMDPLDAKLAGGKYTIVTTLIDGINPAKATELAAKALKNHPQVKCMVGLYAYSVPSILKALEQANQLGKVTVVGFDTHEETLAGIENGHVVATMQQDQYNCGYDTVRALADTLHGERRAVMPNSPMRHLIVNPITKAELDQVRKQGT